jgi:hypothetical protein
LPKEFGSWVEFGGDSPAASDLVVGLMLYAIQWTNFWAVSMSCTRSAKVAVPGGTPVHASGGDWPDPSQVYCAGMAAPSANAELVSRMLEPAELDDVACFAEDPPPPQATVVARRARASVRSTGSFYPKEGKWQTASKPPR